jgi:hypothetical protein
VDAASAEVHAVCGGQYALDFPKVHNVTILRP